MKDWIPYTEVDFSNTKILRFHVDTRDFHCMTHEAKNIDKPFTSFTALERNPEKFVHTQEELKAVLDRLYTESGGKNGWRYLTLIPSKKGTDNWGLKYLRIVRAETGFIICNAEYHALSKEALSGKVNQEFLGAHTL